MSANAQDYILHNVKRLVGNKLFQDIMHVMHAKRRILCAKLLIMGARDQKARREARAIFARHQKALPVNHPDARLIESLLSIDRQNARHLKRIIQIYGWPARSEVGDRASHAAWLIAHHADHDHMFQRMCLEEIKIAVKNGEARARDMAYLTDKVLVAEGRRQVYGTQVFDTRSLDVLYKLSGKELEDAMARITYGTNRSEPLQPLPIDDMDNVDRRRAEVGLPPLRAYIIQINRKVNAGQCHPRQHQNIA